MIAIEVSQDGDFKVLNGAIPEKHREKLSQIIQQVAETLRESEVKVEESLPERPAEDMLFHVAYRAEDGQVEFKCENITGDMVTLFVDLVSRRPEVEQFFRDVVALIDHKKNCDCKGCENWRSDYVKNITEDK